MNIHNIINFYIIIVIYQTKKLIISKTNADCIQILKKCIRFIKKL